MRPTIACVLLLAGCVGAAARAATPMLRPAPAVPIPPPVNADALDRQRAMDRRMDARTQRAIGSVCQGCAGARSRPLCVGAGAVPDREAPVADPAEAPAD